jgi:hypothetical protein
MKIHKPKTLKVGSIEQDSGLKEQVKASVISSLFLTPNSNHFLKYISSGILELQMVPKIIRPLFKFEKLIYVKYDENKNLSLTYLLCLPLLNFTKI